MAGMDLKLRRRDRGTSVFWLILIVGAAVFLLLAIMLIWSERSAEGEPHLTEESVEAEPAVTAGEGDEVPGTTSFDDGVTAESAPGPVGDLPGEPGELDESVPPDGQSDDSEAAGTAGAADADPAPEGSATIAGDAVQPSEAEVEEQIPEVAQEDETEDVVTDPDGTTGAVVPTPSGPEGRDEEVILEEQPASE